MPCEVFLICTHILKLHVTIKTFEKCEGVHVIC